MGKKKNEDIEEKIEVTNQKENNPPQQEYFQRWNCYDSYTIGVDNGI